MAAVTNFLLVFLVVVVGYVQSEDALSDLIVYRTFEWGYESVTVITGDPIDMHCKVQYQNEEVGYDQLMEENVTMSFYKENKLLPDFWVANDTILEEYNVESSSPYSFKYKVANDSHRGDYHCFVEYKNLTGSKKFFVRVKDEPSPLWPGVAFGGEVLLLAFVLGVYELTRNKDELEQEESDTED